MGVRDLGKIVKKYAPNAVTRYSSLAAFRGRRFAIDANLLTTKFHFGTPELQDPERELHRHARSWYYFLRALEREDIQPIVVFDGETRVPEKEKENARRWKARVEQEARGRAEGSRGDRLRQLKQVWDELDKEDRQIVAQALRESELSEERITSELISPEPRTETRPQPPPTEGAMQESSPVAREEPSTSHELADTSGTQQKPSPLSSYSPPSQPVDVPTSEIKSEESVRVEVKLPAAVSSDKSEHVPIVSSTQELELGDFPDLDVEEGKHVAAKDEETSAVAAITLLERLQAPIESIKMLYQSFRADETNPVYSKNQAVVTVEEKAFYRFILAQDSSRDDAVIDDGEELAQVIAKSDKLGSSHRARARGVPRQAFQDTIRLIQALGIPFIKPTSDEPHEAEGICSTLYHQGLVDYVVSEDTDVAVYGAPLLRKISTVPASGPAISQSAENPTSASSDVTALAPLVTDLRSAMNVLDPERLRESLDMTKQQFVDFALLCGTDFTERVPFLGPAKALQYIREIGLIPEIISSQTRYVPADPEAYLESVYAARSIFLNPPPIPSNAILTPQEPQEDLYDVLVEFGILARPLGPQAASDIGPNYVFTPDDVDIEAALSSDDEDQSFYDALEEVDIDAALNEWDEETQQAIFAEVDRLAELHIR